MRRPPVAALACALAVTLVITAQSAAVAPTLRTVYVTVVDDRGNPAANLTAADFGVKEGGKDCAIVSVEPARETIRLALMLEDPLAGQPVMRAGLTEFITRMTATAEISLIVIRQRGETVVDYTSDVDLLAAGIGGLRMSRQSGMVIDAVDDVARQFERTKPARPVIVLVAVQSSEYSDNPQIGLDRIARSRAQLSAVMYQSSGLGSPVIRDGSRQSGGRTIDVAALAVVGDALQQIANDLSSQYLVTYSLPDGARPSDRLTVTLKAAGLTLRSPSRVSNR